MAVKLTTRCGMLKTAWSVRHLALLLRLMYRVQNESKAHTPGSHISSESRLWIALTAELEEG